MAFRLWEAQLQQNNKEWAAAGIVPVPGREQGQTWKDLVKTAYKLQGWKPDTPPANAHMVEVHVSNYSKLHKLDCIRELWNSGSLRFGG